MTSKFLSSPWIGGLTFVAWLVFALTIALHVTRDIQYSPDSMHYVDIAQTFVREGRIATYHLNLNSAEVPDRAVPWPPLYPLLISLPLKAGFDVGDSVRIVSVLVFLVTCAAGARLCVLLAGRGVRGACFALLVSLCGSMEIFGFAWSEPPFIAVVLLFLLCCVQHVRTGTRLSLALAAAFGSLAFMTRYVGVVTAAVGAAVLLQRHFHEENEHGRARLLGNGLLFGGLFAAVAAPWLLRNYLMDGRLFGPSAPPSADTLSTNLLRTWDALRAKVPLAFAVLVAVLLVFAARLALRERALALKSRMAEGGAVLLWFAVAYAALLVALSTRYQIDAIDTRLLSPIYPPLVILAAATVYRLFRNHGSEEGARSVASVCALAILLTVCLTMFPPRPGTRRGTLVREFGTIRPDTTDWVLANTEPDALLIGRGIWGCRFFTGRPVLESGYPCTPNLSKAGLDRFLSAHSNRFANIYLFADRHSELDRAYGEYPSRLQWNSWSVRKLAGP